MARNKSASAGGFTVSGPDVDRSYVEFGPAFSAAITFAERAKADASFYVRDALGRTVGAVEKVNRQTRAYDQRGTLAKAVA